MMADLAVGIALTTDPERAKDKLARFCRAIEEASGLSVKAQGMYHYHHLMSALEEGKVDIVWLPPLLALRAIGRGIVVPIALPVRYGVSTYSAALFTRPDSSIRGLDDLKGVRAAWVDPQSASGYLVIRALLRSKGVDLQTAFSKNTFLGAHDAVAKLVLAGQADVGATFCYLDGDTATATRAPKSAGWSESQVRVLCVAGSIPSDLIATSKQLDPATRTLVRQALTSGEHAELADAAADLLGAERFVAASQEHLDSLAEILKDLDDEPSSTRAYKSVFPPPSGGR
jgi:phosphonate transport system substrate-binding protein